jgi:serine/threonine protein kinase
MENSAIKRLGRYEILAELGRGAMGVVYKARDPQIDRFVALKTVSLWGQEPDQEAEFRLRFINEAQAAGRLHHPGIVSVFDMGENPENRDPYIVLEYVSGESLNKILHREKKLLLPRALKLAEEIADALDYAHTQGVVHRDIKPANILINETGNAKIADFGIAKLNLAHFTLPGRVLGTPAYMAPEQLSGEGADGRSDLFSLGVILYTMVTGHSPFQGNSATTVCFKVANREPVAASALDLTLPADIDAIIARAMAKLPEERYQRGAEFAADLRMLQQQQGTSKSTTSRIPMSASGTTLTGMSSSATGANPASAAALADVKKVVNHIRFKAPIRDLVLGAATIVGLVIVGVQSKLLVTTSRTASPVGPVVSLPPATSADSARLPAPDDLQAPASDQSGASIHAAPTNPPVRTARVIPAKSEAKKTVAKVSQPKAPTQIPTTMLDLTVQHQFKDATLFVWIDDKLALTRPLHGAAQKKLVVFNDVRGVESDSLKVPAGRHVLRFRALSSDQTIDLSKTISADFVAGDGKSLQITFDKRNSAMKIAWQ